MSPATVTLLRDEYIAGTAWRAANVAICLRRLNRRGPAHLLLDDSREGRVDVALGARAQGMDL